MSTTILDMQSRDRKDGTWLGSWTTATGGLQSDQRRGVAASLLAQPELRVTDRTTFRAFPMCHLWDRIERDPEARTRGAYIPPDIAVEIMSPGQGQGTQLERCRWFVAHGSQVALLIDSNRDPLPK
jgi:hypothetical protein